MSDRPSFANGFWVGRHLHTGDLLLFDPHAPRPAARSIWLFDPATRRATQVWEEQLALVVRRLSDPQVLRCAIDAYVGGSAALAASVSVHSKKTTRVVEPRKSPKTSRSGEKSAEPYGTPKRSSKHRGLNSHPALDAINEVRSRPRPKRIEPMPQPEARKTEDSAALPIPSSRTEIIRELKKIESRNVAKEVERQSRKADLRNTIPEHEEGVPRPGWATDEEVAKMRKGYGR